MKYVFIGHTSLYLYNLIVDKNNVGSNRKNL